MSFTSRLIPAAAAAALLAACGGGGGTAPDSSTPPVTASSGVAVDGYLQFATVLCDGNGNGVSDAGERGAGTDASGRFTFSPACTDALVVTGGTNADTGLPFTGVLKAPAGATVVSPLTTLIAEGLAPARLVAVLGLAAGTDVLVTDPAATSGGSLVNPDLFRRTLAMQQLIQKTAEVMAALSGQDSAAAARTLYTVVARAFAEALASGAPLMVGGTIDAAVATALVEAAAAAAAAAFPFTTEVNAATLAQIAGPALALQSELILAAGAGELTEVVRAAQTSTLIADFVAANAASLAAAPGDASAALSAALAAQVDPWVALADDSIRLVYGGSATAYSLSQFESADGIRVGWPLAEPAMLEITLANAALYEPTAGQKLSAAVSISETTTGGQGTILAYIDQVGIERIGNTLKLSVPTTAAAKVYGVSGDGAKKAVVDFRNSVRNVTGTFNTAAGVPTSFPLGNIVNYAINQLSNDFTGIYGLRGRYQVSVVLTGLSLRRADGSQLPPLSIEVPTSLNRDGSVAASHTVAGRGLVGHITLAD